MSRMGSSRHRYPAWLGAIALAALVGVPAPRARAAEVITVDPDAAPGGVAPVNVVTFDEDPGNALITGNVLGGVGAPVGSVVGVIYQATITNLKNAASTTVAAYQGQGGVGNVPGELTIVATFNEVILDRSGPATNQTVTLGLNTDQTGSFFEIYYDTTADANNLTGAGFNDGVLVYRGQVNRDGTGTFTADLTGLDDLDNFVNDDYPGIDSITGSGGTELSVTTVFANPAYFLTPLTGTTFNLNLFFNSSIVLPFQTVDPASRMFNGVVAAGTIGSGAGSTIGPINGVSGPNTLLQADANSSFILQQVPTIPEPGTVSMALTAIGLTSLAALRRRRRNPTSAA